MIPPGHLSGPPGDGAGRGYDRERGVKVSSRLSRAARWAQPPHGLMPTDEVAFLIASPSPTG